MEIPVWKSGSRGFELPVLGLGTWRMGEVARRRRQELRALALGLDLGFRLIDTAEMYGSGGAEELVGEAIAGRRDQVILVSKVLPENASRQGTIQAAERSLRRLGTDCIDLYLLHWQGLHPLADTLLAFARLEEAGKIRAFGVSNFDVAALSGACSLPFGERIVADQVLYNLSRRSVEAGLLGACRERGIALMAYSPLEQGRLDFRGVLASVAKRHSATPAQVALAWTLRQDGVIVIPKAGNLEHVRENRGAVDLVLTDGDLEVLDAAYPAPEGPAPLEWL
ncbi:MAG: aldo/keto reductase [Planctomycetota bacterium]